MLVQFQKLLAGTDEDEKLLLRWTLWHASPQVSVPEWTVVLPFPPLLLSFMTGNVPSPCQIPGLEPQEEDELNSRL